MIKKFNSVMLHGYPSLWDSFQHLVNKKYNFIALLLLSFFFLSCGKGIDPSSVEDDINTAGFSGTITFVGEWPSDINFTFLVAFDSLLLEPNDFNVFNLKFISSQIPNGVSEYNYNSLDSASIEISAGDYEYVAVIQSTDDVVSLDRSSWFVSGIYYNNGNTSEPGKLVIPEDTFVRYINIICDFNNPPPQPPGG